MSWKAKETKNRHWLWLWLIYSSKWAGYQLSLKMLYFAGKTVLFSIWHYNQILLSCSAQVCVFHAWLCTCIFRWWTNRTPAARSSDFVITRMITDRIGLHLVLLPLLTVNGFVIMSLNSSDRWFDDNLITSAPGSSLFIFSLRSCSFVDLPRYFCFEILSLLLLQHFPCMSCLALSFF